jgi:hypothetical protein
MHIRLVKLLIYRAYAWERALSVSHRERIAKIEAVSTEAAHSSQGFQEIGHRYAIV